LNQAELTVGDGVFDQRSDRKWRSWTPMCKPNLNTAIAFEPVRTATHDASEMAHLVRFNESIVALLLPAETGWFLQMGFGPCEQEGLIFQTLSAAEFWVRSCLKADTSVSIS
jgi:hypothetical protein